MLRFIVPALLFLFCCGCNDTPDPAPLPGGAETGATPPLTATNAATNTATKTVSPAPDTDALAAEALAAEAAHFALEVKARKAEEGWLVPFWDRMRTAKDPFDVLLRLPLGSLDMGAPIGQEKLEGRIIRLNLGPGGQMVSRAGWQQQLRELQKSGYLIQHSDWHQEAFDQLDVAVYRSRIRFTVHCIKPAEAVRSRFQGLLDVDWAFGDEVLPTKMQLVEMRMERRRGAPGFMQRFFEAGQAMAEQGPRQSTGVLLLRDVVRSGRCDIVVGGANQIYRNQGNWSFANEVLAPALAGKGLAAGLLADMDGDGVDDLIGANPGALFLIRGEAGGRFPGAAIPIRSRAAIRYPTAITAGDIDLDGDLDLYLSQWREIGDKMPAPYWDARDGHGNALLLNDGKGGFEDVTAARGLAEKNKRRSYSASFFDADDDRDLDLVVVSDFYGVDLYLNDGKGQFRDVTGTQLDEVGLFGMSHTFGDFDQDGSVDMFALGMGSSTARRLEAMGAGPSRLAEHNRQRMVLGYGNRMYLRQADGGYRQPAFIEDVARTGWAWGSAAFDFENDGDTDIYIANGNISGTSSRDYCTHFWCKDIYATPDLSLDLYREVVEKVVPDLAGMSWDGFQPNQLLLNRNGKGFHDAGFLLDVGFPFDARQVVATDLDADGRVDLLMTRIGGTTGMRSDGAGGKVDPPAVIGMQNMWRNPSPQNWIAIDLHGAGAKAMGALVEVHAGGRVFRDIAVTGDSHGAQHPATIHVGLGKITAVEKLVVKWVGGSESTLPSPPVNQVHRARP